MTSDLDALVAERDALRAAIELLRDLGEEWRKLPEFLGYGDCGALLLALLSAPAIPTALDEMRVERDTLRKVVREVRARAESGGDWHILALLPETE